jgi:hypothetical protein
MMRKATLMPALAIAGLIGLTACSNVDYETLPSDPPPPAGSLELTIITTGEDLDVDGYTAALDCGCFADVETNDVATMASVEPGSHLVLLTGIAANCALDGPNPRWISVEADETAAVTFSVVCNGYR